MIGVNYMENCKNGEYEFVLQRSEMNAPDIRIKFTVDVNGQVAYQKPEL